MTFEETLILMIIGFAGVLGSVITIKIVNPFGMKVKKSGKKNTNLEIIEEQHKAIQENFLIEIAQLKKDKQGLYGKINRLQAKNNEYSEQFENSIEEIEPNVDDIQSKYEIVPEKAVKYIAELGLNPEALSNPALTPIFWSKVSENIELAQTIGIIRLKGTGANVAQPEKVQDSGQAFINSIISQNNNA